MNMRFAALALLVAAADAAIDAQSPVNCDWTGTTGSTCDTGCCFGGSSCSPTAHDGTYGCCWDTWEHCNGRCILANIETCNGDEVPNDVEWNVSPTYPSSCESWSGTQCGSGCCLNTYSCDNSVCCPPGSTYDSSNNVCNYGVQGGSDPCFSREDTTVCRLTDAAVAPSAAFEQCFGGAVSSQAERVPMKDLVAGDVVLSSPTAATAVLVQQHAEASARKATMLLLEHETGTLVLTPDHVLKIDGAFKPAREAAVGGVLEPASRITKVSTVTRGIISPITLSGQLLAAGRAGAPVVATVWPEWIAPLMLSSALYPLPYSLASAAAYLFPASVQQFYNEQLEALFTQASPGLKGLKAAVPAPVALAILAGFDAACVGAFAAWACGLKGLVALLAVGLAATARRAAKKA